jgi:hypothetical protein
MEGNPEDMRVSSSEEGEALHINSIVIPADDEQLLDQRQIKPASLADYQDLVGGYIEAVDLTHPPARMYVNEEGKLRGMPMNRRATMLLWMHNRAFRYGDIIAGDAFLVGPTSRESQDTAVRDEYIQMLFQARSFHVEVQMQGDEQWRPKIWPLETWHEAYSFALGWAIGPDDRQRASVVDIRVVPDT